MPSKQPKRGGRANSGGPAKQPPPDQPTTGQRKAGSSPDRSRRRTIITVALLSVFTVALWWWTNRPVSEPDAAAAASANPNTFGPEIVALERIKGLPAELDHPVFWAGEQADTSYELTIAKAGQVGIRYLPKSGASAAARDGEQARTLTIATSPKVGAYETAQEALATPGGTSAQTPSGSLVFQDPAQPQVGYLVRPGLDYLVSVFDPAAGRTWEMLSADLIVPIES